MLLDYIKMFLPGGVPQQNKTLSEHSSSSSFDSLNDVDNMLVMDPDHRENLYEFLK